MGSMSEIFRSLGEGAINEIEKRAQNIARDKRASEEQKMAADKWTSLKEGVHNRESAGEIINRLIDREDEDIYEENDEDDIDDELCGNFDENYVTAWRYEKGQFSYSKSPDYKKAKYYYELSAQDGNSEAAYRIGEIYYRIERDINRALDWYLKAAKQGYAKAQAMYGDILYASYYFDEAIEWLQKAAEQDIGLAQYDLAEAYEYGNGVPQDVNRALLWYQKAYTNGYPGAEEKVILLGDKQELDIDEAEIKRLKEEASRGFLKMKLSDANKYYEIKRIEDSYSIGLQYEEGTYPGCSGPEYEKAKSSYMLAAKYGNVDAIYKIGEIYYKINGDENKAVDWYRKAAKQGHAKAQAMYGIVLYEMHYYDEAIEWLQKTTEQNIGLAQYDLAEAYEYGNGVPQDENRALLWYKKAYENGCLEACEKVILLDDKQELDIDEAEIKRLKEEYSRDFLKMKMSDLNKYYEIKRIEDSYSVGLQYEEGTYPGCNRPNYEEAKTSYMLAAKYGNIEAVFRIGEIYYHIEENEVKALAWYLKAAKQGHAEAQAMYGAIMSGAGYYDEAIEWLQKAAEQDIGLAQMVLAEMYEYGDGVPQDVNKALHWYKKAEKNEYPEAAEKIMLLKEGGEING